MSKNMQEGISGLLWYAECKELALDAVMSFRPPADLHAMRMYHSLYLTSLQSLLEFADDLFGPKAVPDAWKRALDGQGGQTGENNADYLRELRNSIIHRGTDIVAAGTVVNGQTCAVSPPEARNESGKKGHTAFAPLLRNVFAVCENAIGPAILPLANDALTAEEERTAEAWKMDCLKSVDETPHMQDWVKEMARKHVDKVPFEELRGFQAKKLRELLSRGAPSGLAILV